MSCEKVRIDKYLWAIRIFKTRSLAAAACEKGKVKIEGNDVKASRTVRVGDKYTIKTDARNSEIEVIIIIEQRVQFADAIKNYIDHTPEEERKKEAPQSSVFVFETGKRQSKQGRPTKKERRNLDDFLES
jgi:ribosome-associated heat shock protein Hsp15